MKLSTLKCFYQTFKSFYLNVFTMPSQYDIENSSIPSTKYFFLFITILRKMSKRFQLTAKTVYLIYRKE